MSPLKWIFLQLLLSYEDVVVVMKHTYAFKHTRFAKQWTGDSSHEQHENAKIYLKEPLKRGSIRGFVQVEQPDAQEEQSKQEVPSKEQKALEEFFWSQIKVLFCTNAEAGHELPKTKFKPDVTVMDQANHATVLNCLVTGLSWMSTKLIMAGDIRQPNPDPPILADYAHNGFMGLSLLDILKQHVGTPEKLYQDFDYTIVVLHDQ